MVSLKKFKAMAEKFSKVADFIIIYIKEAHPAENMDFINIVRIKSHQTLNDRINAGKSLYIKVYFNLSVHGNRSNIHINTKHLCPKSFFYVIIFMVYKILRDNIYIMYPELTWTCCMILLPNLSQISKVHFF